jgi:hypothetical protein
MGFLIGLIVMGLGLFGLGLALTEMMTHADPHGTVKTVGGLALFIVMSLLTLRFAR